MLDKSKIMPSQKYLKECFEILKLANDQWTLRWKTRPAMHFKDYQSANAWNARNAGKYAVSIDSEGYYSVQINGEKWKQHRVIWKMIYGQDPKGDLDHIDQNKLNNNISNLRETDDYLNSKNMSMFKNNKSGVTGVNFMHDRKSRPWRAQINWHGKKKNLGNFASIDDAIEARKQAEKILGYTNQ
jgi:hypothetical protein